MTPLFPVEEVPEEKEMSPETPAVPAFGVRRENGPEEVGAEYPVVIDMYPPDAAAVVCES